MNTGKIINHECNYEGILAFSYYVKNYQKQKKKRGMGAAMSLNTIFLCYQEVKKKIKLLLQSWYCHLNCMWWTTYALIYLPFILFIYLFLCRLSPLCYLDTLSLVRLWIN